MLAFSELPFSPLNSHTLKKKWQRMVGVVLVEQHIEQQQQSRVNKGVRNGSNFDYRQVSNQSTYISHKKRHELWPGSWALILCFGTRGDSKRPHRETGDVYSDSFCALTGLGTNAFCCSKIPLKKWPLIGTLLYFYSFQQLPWRAFSVDKATFKGPKPCFVHSFKNYRGTQTPSCVPHYTQRFQDTLSNKKTQFLEYGPR